MSDKRAAYNPDLRTDLAPSKQAIMGRSQPLPTPQQCNLSFFLHFFSLFLSFLEKGRSLYIGTLRPFFISPGIPSRVAAEKKPSGRALIYNYAHGHKTYGGFFMKKSTLFLIPPGA
jgi:hypothetical protein